jgi:predicted metalloprotease with PDZ domain
MINIATVTYRAFGAWLLSIVLVILPIWPTVQSAALPPQATTKFSFDHPTTHPAISYHASNLDNSNLDNSSLDNNDSNDPDLNNNLKLAYNLAIKNPVEHFFYITLQVSNNRADSLDFALPAWSPGRYVIYNFATNVQDFTAQSSAGNTLAWHKTDKQTWQVKCRGSRNVTVSYKIFADQLSGTFSQLNAQHANYNGASIFMYVAQHKNLPLTLTIEKPADWEIINGASDQPNQTEFKFANYDLLIDTPTEIGKLTVDSFSVGTQTYRLMFHDLRTSNEQATDPDARPKLLAALQQIVATQINILGTPDLKHYTFLVHLTGPFQGGDGMEHLTSTQVISNSLNQAIATCSHEFFHLWNVKRLRPVELGPWDYTREVYTKSLWIAEGLTSYYGSLSLARSGVWSRSQYYDQLAEEIQVLENRPGRKIMSLEQSSWDTWLFLAAPRSQTTNLDNTTISYYNKGEVVGAMLNLEIQARTNNRKSLDDVMRKLYEDYYLHSPANNYYYKGQGYPYEAFLKTVNKVTGSDFTEFFKAYVSGTADIDYDQFLEKAGLELVESDKNSYKLREIPQASAEQRALREAWLSGRSSSAATAN